MIFFSPHYPRLMATGTADWFPKILLKVTKKTLVGWRLSILSLSLDPFVATLSTYELKSKRSARVIKSESINGTS
jgi:hypothetical protein